MAKTIIVLNAFFVFSACGGSGGGSGAGGLGGSAQDAINYTPVYASGPTDTTTDAIGTTGVTGVMSQFDVSATSVSTRLRSVKVRLSPDGSTAYLTVDGSTQSLPVTISTPGGGQFGNVPSNVLQVNSSNTTHNLVSFSGTSGTTGFGAFGFIGIETPISELPTGNATYSGNWGGQVYSASNTFGDSGVLSGTMSVTANFGDGSVGGSFTGSVNAGDTGDFAGTVSGSTSGNGVVASMDITSGDFTGNMPFAAKTFGFDGSDLAGAFAGNIRSNASGKNYATTGTFSLD
ncbi:transferrin-binding protein-like solute binding protein [Yoonia sp. F2084L]|uniref:transferrin-binding protein-like solute binding protein n=1 Tax=Yoonia sp. F2084L TaxID=2926419 RepID=UPI001FF574AD|nr:transferrin-binding protein-like solute binding protein [Yoonia sp. F2084L]MCK0094292.1 transferrin-binding protein-like solute binding protein [Yoonia sp. F2084L]